MQIAQQLQIKQPKQNKPLVMQSPEQLYLMELLVDYLNDSQNFASKNLPGDMQKHLSDIASKSKGQMKPVLQGHDVYAAISKELKHIDIAELLQATYSNNQLQTFDDKYRQLEQIIIIPFNTGRVNLNLSLAFQMNYQDLKNSVLELKVTMQAIYVQQALNNPANNALLNPIALKLLALLKMEDILLDAEKCPISQQNERIPQLTICTSQSTVSNILLNFLREPDLSMTEDSTKARDNKNKVIHHSLYYDLTNKQHYQVVNGKVIALKVRYNDTNGNPMAHEELFEAKIKAIGKLNGKLSWKKLNTYFSGWQHPMTITRPARGYEVLNKETSECKDEFCGELLNVLKQQGRDQVIITSHARQDYYFYYSDKDNNLKYIECDGVKNTLEINQALRLNPAYEVFSDILIARIAQSILSNGSDNPISAARIGLPKELVNYQASKTPLILKHGLNLSADLFKATPIKENNTSLEFNGSVPKSCIQHTEFLMRKAQGNDYAFEYDKEAAGTDEVLHHKLDMRGSYTDVNGSIIKVNFSKDNILDVLENNPIKKSANPELPKYGEGLAVLTTKLNHVTYNMHFSMCLGVVAGKDGKQIASLMTDVAEPARFLDQQLGEKEWKVTLDDQHFNVDEKKAHLLEDEKFKLYSGDDVTRIFDPLPKIKASKTNLLVQVKYKNKIGESKIGFIFFNTEDKKSSWLAPKDAEQLTKKLNAKRLTKKVQAKQLPNAILIVANDFRGDKLMATREINLFLIRSVADFHRLQEDSVPEKYFQGVTLQAMKP